MIRRRTATAADLSITFASNATVWRGVLVQSSSGEKFIATGWDPVRKVMTIKRATRWRRAWWWLRCKLGFR